MSDSLKTVSGSLGCALIFVLTGCGDGSGPGGFGSIEVQTVTTGAVPDADGYQVTVDDVRFGTVPATGTVTISSVPAGSRSVRLVGVADQCTVGGNNPKLVEVVAGESLSIDFNVVCGTPVGSVQVEVSTTGDDIDADGYTIFAADQQQQIPSNGAVLFTGLPEGVVDILIDEIAPNCVLTSDPRPSVIVPAGGEVQAGYSLSCLGPLPNDLAFSAALQGSDSPQDVFRVNANGTQASNLTSSSHGDSPSWSPDGAHIAFNGAVAGTTHLMVMDADGSNVRDLNVELSGPAWSPDGTRLAASDGLNIFVINADGTGLTKITNRVKTPGAESGASSPAWSPDRTRIAYAAHSGVPITYCYVINVDGTAETQIMGGCDAPAWSPDGAKIAFSGATGHISVMRPDGSELMDLTAVAAPSAEERGPAWSPDGSQLAFVSNRGVPEDLETTFNIFVMNADGTGARRVTESGTYRIDLAHPTWSPPLH